MPRVPQVIQEQRSCKSFVQTPLLSELLKSCIRKQTLDRLDLVLLLNPLWHDDETSESGGSQPVWALGRSTGRITAWCRERFSRCRPRGFLASRARTTPPESQTRKDAGTDRWMPLHAFCLVSEKKCIVSRPAIFIYSIHTCKTTSAEAQVAHGVQVVYPEDCSPSEPPNLGPASSGGARPPA